MQQKGLIPHKKYQSFLSLKNTFTGQAIMKDNYSGYSASLSTSKDCSVKV